MENTVSIENTENILSKKSVRNRADQIRPFRCKNFIAVLENPMDIKNIGTVVRNVNALGVEKLYVVDPRRSLDHWEQLRNNRTLSKTSVSAVKWTFVKRFDSTEECFRYLQSKGFISIVTSPHVKDKENALFQDVDYTQYKKLAVWFGSESTGISEYAVSQSKLCISIPMFGMIESLNLGTSSGIVLHEIAKQRRDFQSKLHIKLQTKSQTIKKE